MGDINNDISTATKTSTDYIQMLLSNAYFLLLANQQK